MSKYLKWGILAFVLLGAFSVAIAQGQTIIYMPIIAKNSTPTPTPTFTPTPTNTPKPSKTPTFTPTPTSVPNVFIDDIEPNPKDDPLDEYVQIKNGTSKSINLEDWRLRDESGNIFFFPNFTLGASRTVKVWTKVGVDDSSNLYWDRTEEVWNDHSDCAYLRDQDNELIDSECYSLPLSWLYDLLH